MFNRHAILTRYYAETLRHEYKWDKIAAECKANAEYDRDADANVGYCWLGSVFGCTPSGKIYAPWTSNQTRSDETRDGAWFDALEQVADEHGLFVSSPDGGDGVYVAATFDAPDTDDDE